MSYKHLRTSPVQSPDGTWWRYEDSKGLEILHQPVINGVAQRVERWRISWAALRGALKRKDRR